VITETKLQTIKIDIKNRPEAIGLKDITWYVVTAENIDEFKGQFKEDTGGELVFYALSVNDYERLAINMAEITRYIEQQQSLLVYYEEAIKAQTGVKQ